MDFEFEKYILDHIDAEPGLLQKINRDTQIKFVNGRMVSGHLQGRILVMICRMINPERVLELGTFTGYSALCLAEGTKKDAEIHTIEINDEFEETIRYWLHESGYEDKIILHIGDALEIVPTMAGEFDLVFMDMDKRDYLKCYKTILPKVKPGGFIIADNTLWYGKVIGKIEKSDTQSLAISEFNDYIAVDTRVEKVILPIRDGLTLIRKKD